jgi:ABC-type nitrate/sulfonate/bicarbonate transport system permease component
MRVMGASGFQRFWFADRVYATPHILAAWRQSSLLAVIGAVVGEFSIPSSGGLAYCIQVSMQWKDKVFACLILLGLMGGIFYGIAVLTDMLVHLRYERGIPHERRKTHEA